MHMLNFEEFRGGTLNFYPPHLKNEYSLRVNISGLVPFGCLSKEVITIQKWVGNIICSEKYQFKSK